MWTGLIGNQVIGPVQLPNPLNAENYLDFLQDILPGLLDGVPEELQENLIFMHDGAPAHTAVNVRNYLDQVYGGHWIGNNGPVRWPARSPDLNPLDYFYWGTSKEAVYHNGGLNDPNDMIQRIQHHAQHLEPEKIHAAIHQIRRRAILCIQQQGGISNNAWMVMMVMNITQLNIIARSEFKLTKKVSELTKGCKDMITKLKPVQHDLVTN
ncbi:uncharacterized protein LOC131675773 [Phymastichus coffea]|uniref:uncharacterized protein LOC131675773 n=1 Tax=Phymastichus coffea TaxID=108790 RepID=UPI00273BDDCB|nr:uncharacterized protein LOC131675773 [Phymastichus coffea]